MVIKKNRPNKDVLFINAADKEYYIKDSAQNVLTPQSIQKIREVYDNRQEVEKFSHLASFDEIKENDFNLNIPRYVDTFEEEEEIDLAAVKAEIANLEIQLSAVQDKMSAYLKELGV